MDPYIEKVINGGYRFDSTRALLDELEKPRRPINYFAFHDTFDDLSKSFRVKTRPINYFAFHDTFDDLCKSFRVKTWMDVDNPVIASCRCCGYRGFVDDPTIGIY